MMRSRPAVIFLLLLIAGVGLLVTQFGPRAAFFLTPAATMSVTHTVLFQFKADANPEEVKAVCAQFLALKTNCIHPTTNTPYIISLKGGKDNSPEGLQNGITHGFVAEFANADDRNYYVKTDPAHQAFIKLLGGLVIKAVVVDFSDGEF